MLSCCILLACTARRQRSSACAGACNPHACQPLSAAQAAGTVQVLSQRHSCVFATVGSEGSDDRVVGGDGRVRLIPWPPCNDVALEATPHRRPISAAAVDAGGDLVFTSDGAGIVLMYALVTRSPPLTPERQVRPPVAILARPCVSQQHRKQAVICCTSVELIAIMPACVAGCQLCCALCLFHVRRRPTGSVPRR